MSVLPLAVAVLAFVGLLVGRRAPATTPATETGAEEGVLSDVNLGLNGRPVLYARVGEDGSQ